MSSYVNGDLEDFYASCVRRLVGQMYLLTGDLGAAEEVVQEAFVRLIPRWQRVSAYEDPEGFVRRVAMGLATNRWHRARTAAAHLARQRNPEAEAGPDGLRLDLVRALQTLPAQQRRAVVLHYVLGLSVAEVAAETSVAEGTVKSRLSRARSRLAPLLRLDVDLETADGALT